MKIKRLRIKKFNLKTILGILIIISSILLGLWVGVWVLFVGGIMNIIEVIRGHAGALMILWGLIKMALASIVGWIVVYVGFALRTVIIDS